MQRPNILIHEIPAVVARAFRRALLLALPAFQRTMYAIGNRVLSSSVTELSPEDAVVSAQGARPQETAESAEISYHSFMGCHSFVLATCCRTHVREVASVHSIRRGSGPLSFHQPSIVQTS